MGEAVKKSKYEVVPPASKYEVVPPESGTTANPNQGMIDLAKQNLNTPQGGKAPAELPLWARGVLLKNDIETGMSKGFWGHAADLSGALNKVPIVGKYLAPEEGVRAFKNITTPEGTAQNIGHGIERAGEFMVPGLGEEKAVAALAPKLPTLGRAAVPLARIGYNALTTGAINKAQGGGFGSGALIGGGGSAVGEGLKAAAPLLADTALGVRIADRMRGKIPGKAILSETTGVNPADIAEQAKDKVSLLDKELETAAKRSPIPASTAGARQAIGDEMNTATARNSAKLYGKLNDINGQLTTDFRTGQPFPINDTPEHILQLKRGMGDLVASWNPKENPKSLDSAVKRVYGSLDSELDRTIPESAGLNDRMANLIPVVRRAEEKAANPGFFQKAIGRATVHTGASATGALGAIDGYHRNGIPGAVLEGGAGVVLPEVIGNPTAQMAIARFLNSPAQRTAIRAAIGGGLQATKTKEEEDQ